MHFVQGPKGEPHTITLSSIELVVLCYAVNWLNGEFVQNDADGKLVHDLAREANTTIYRIYEASEEAIITIPSNYDEDGEPCDG